MTQQSSSEGCDCPSRLVGIPVLGSIFKIVNDLYSSAKNKSRLIKFSLNFLEFNVKIVADKLILCVPCAIKLRFCCHVSCCCTQNKELQFSKYSKPVELGLKVFGLIGIRRDAVINCFDNTSQFFILKMVRLLFCALKALLQMLGRTTKHRYELRIIKLSSNCSGPIDDDYFDFTDTDNPLILESLEKNLENPDKEIGSGSVSPALNDYVDAEEFDD